MHYFRGLALFIQCYVNERKLSASAGSHNLQIGVVGIAPSKPSRGGVAFTIFSPSLFKLVPCEKCGRDETVRLGCLSLPHRVCWIDCGNHVHVSRILAKFINRDCDLPLSLKRFTNIFVRPGKSSLPVSIARVHLRSLGEHLLTRMVLGQRSIELLLLVMVPAVDAVICCHFTQ